VVNAAGPWTAQVLHAAVPKEGGGHLRLIKGSHIIVRRIFEHEHAYIFQHRDGRIVFAIPYEREFTLIGTTDLDYHGDANQVAISEEEIRYLCRLASEYFVRPVMPADVVSSYSGVRPLVEDGADAKAVTRDYRLEVDQDGPPLLSVFGGKITTYRKLAEDAVDQVARALDNRHGPWTHDACLPGGDLFGAKPQNRSVLEFDSWVRTVQNQYAWLPPLLVARYARAYGTRLHTLLAQKPRWPTWARKSCPACMWRKWTTCAAMNGRARHRISCGAVPNWACTCLLTRRSGCRTGCWPIPSSVNENGACPCGSGAVLRWAPRARRCRDYFTPCISFWISGAIRNSSTPPAISDQKPKV
jgi:hypothetical protein